MVRSIVRSLLFVGSLQFAACRAHTPDAPPSPREAKLARCAELVPMLERQVLSLAPLRSVQADNYPATLATLYEAELAVGTMTAGLKASGQPAHELERFQFGLTDLRTNLESTLRTGKTDPKDLEALNVAGKVRSLLTDAAPGLEALQSVDERCGDLNLESVDWLAVKDNSDPRHFTVWILGVMPEPIAKAFDTYGLGEAPFNIGRLGTAVLVVRRIEGRLRTFAVTNRHVVGHAEILKVMDARGVEMLNDESNEAAVVQKIRATANDAKVSYIDLHGDLAVLEVSPDAEGKNYDVGVGLEPLPPANGQAVVAVGFPLTDDRPQYELARGSITGKRKLVAVDEEIGPYIEHSAPTRSGYSGGPLLSARGRLVGINQGVEKSGALLALPADLVVADLRAASEPPSSARLACLTILGELTRKEVSPLAELRLTTTFIANAGASEYDKRRRALQGDARQRLDAQFESNAIDFLAKTAFDRLRASLLEADPRTSLKSCDAVTTTGAQARVVVQTPQGPRDLTLVHERGQWAVDEYDFRHRSATNRRP